MTHQEHNLPLHWKAIRWRSLKNSFQCISHWARSIYIYNIMYKCVSVRLPETPQNRWAFYPKLNDPFVCLYRSAISFYSLFMCTWVCVCMQRAYIYIFKAARGHKIDFGGNEGEFFIMNGTYVRNYMTLNAIPIAWVGMKSLMSINVHALMNYLQNIFDKV